MKGMGKVRRWGVLLLCAGASAAGCSDPTGSEAAVEVTGVVRWLSTAAAETATWPDETSVVIEAPDTVDAGVPFPVVVWTLGSSGCWEVAGTDVDAAPALAEVTPVDRDRMREGLACTGVIVELEHEVTLTFTEPGEALIRVLGREVVGDDFHSGKGVSVEKVVVVE